MFEFPQRDGTEEGLSGEPPQPYLSQISRDGLVTIKFDKPLNVPTQELDPASIFAIEVLSSQYWDPALNATAISNVTLASFSS